MTTTPTDQAIQMFEFIRDETIDAPIEIVFEAILDEIGPEGQIPDGKPFPMKLEPWPGGRWFRDLGNDTGHFWGHVQVIKPPMLVELCGPMFMSFPAMNHVQYRLVAEGDGTRLKFAHKAIGQIPREYLDGMDEGWAYRLRRIHELAARRSAQER